MNFFKLSLAALPILALPALAPACSTADPVSGPESNLSELTPDCLKCLGDLTECSSTAQNEAQFIECRDVFQSCQDTMNLGPDECGRPTNRQACELCRERLDGCSEGSCDAEFSVCKAFLMTRDQEACDVDPPPVQGNCEACIETLATCASSGGDASACASTFDACRSANGIDPEQCGMPTEGVACEACFNQQKKCEAASEEGCDEGWSACEAQLASEGACGGTGSGGGGGGGAECAHDTCAVGTPLDASCSSCATAVCAVDSYCCEFAYDETCVQLAQQEPACGCVSDTCVHDVCTAGEALVKGCNECSTTVCDADDFCCTYEWDPVCVQKAVELCGATCEG